MANVSGVSWDAVGLVVLGAVLVSALAAFAAWMLARRQRRLAQQDRARQRQAETLAKLLAIIDDGPPYGADARQRVLSAERDLTAAALLDDDEGGQQASDTAVALRALLDAVRAATTTRPPHGTYETVESTFADLQGEVNVLAGVWKEP